MPSPIVITRAPLGEARAEPRYSAIRSRRPSRPSVIFSSVANGKRLGALVDLDAGDDAALLEQRREGHAVLRLLAQRLVEQDHAADELLGAGGREEQLAIGAAVLLRRRQIDVLKRFSIVPELSSAARMPLWGATRARAVSASWDMDVLSSKGRWGVKAGCGAADPERAWNGAAERTRTSMGLLPPAPQAGASTNFATAATSRTRRTYRRRTRSGGVRVPWLGGAARRRRRGRRRARGPASLAPPGCAGGRRRLLGCPPRAAGGGSAVLEQPLARRLRPRGRRARGSSS